MPTITISLDEDANKLIEIYQAANGLKTKEEAINKIVNEAKQIILKSVGK
jgi:hypothetical protein